MRGSRPAPSGDSPINEVWIRSCICSPRPAHERACGRNWAEVSRRRLALRFKLPAMPGRCEGTERAHQPSRLQLQDPATGWPHLLHRVVVARAATPIIWIGTIGGIRNRCRYRIVGNREQQLLPHFGKAGTAIFAVKHVEYSGHDRTLAWSTIFHAIAFQPFRPRREMNSAREFFAGDYDLVPKRTERRR